MQSYSDLVPPTGVSHSVSSNFLGPNAANLVVVRTSILQIFSLKQLDGDQGTKLVLNAEYSLAGTVTGLCSVSLQKSKSGGDALLLAFLGAKLSLIEWDPYQYSISTISIHYYENHDLLLCPWPPDLSECASHLIIDPSSRCAAFNFGVNNLAIIPFHQAGDDLAMGDLDDLDNDDNKLVRTTTRERNGETEAARSPYGTSFVLPLTALDPVLLHPVSMNFLHEYREPTIGILFSTQAQSHNMAPERRDVMIYAVYTLDLDQRASTTLASIPKLPNDLSQVYAVPPPVGGALLVGANEIIHVDRGGKVNAIGVNEFAKETSSLPMADQSDLKLRLEDCRLETLGNATNDMLIVTNTGQMVILTFRIDGRSVSGLTLRMIDRSWTEGVIRTGLSTTTPMGGGRLFFGSEQSDSLLVSLGKKTVSAKRQNSRAFLDDTNGQVDVDSEGSDDTDGDDDDDDLYADTTLTRSSQSQGIFDGSNIKILDHLSSLAPIHDIAMGRSTKQKKEEQDSETDRLEGESLELVLACGGKAAGSLAFLSKALLPRYVKRHKIAAGSGLWSLSSEPVEEGSSARPFDDMIITTTTTSLQSGRTDLLSISAGNLAKMEATEFERGDETIAAGQMITGSYAVIYSSEVRVYDQDFGLAQIFPVVDEESDATSKVITASVGDHHVLLLKEDNTLTLLKMDKSGDLDEIDIPDSVPSSDIISASLYHDATNFFETSRYYTNKQQATKWLLVVLTATGTVSIFSLPKLQIQIYSFSGTQFLPPFLSSDPPLPKHWRNKDDLVELILADLGDINSRRPHLVVRNSVGDIVVYEAFGVAGIEGAYRFRKITSRNADAQADQQDELNEPVSRSSLVPMQDVGGLAVVFVKGEKPSVIIKTASSLPHIYSLATGPIKGVSSFHDSSCNRGFVFIDENSYICFSEFPTNVIHGISDWVIKKLEIGEQVSKLTYFPRTQSYVLAVDSSEPFHLPRDDEWHPEWETDNEKASNEFLPTVLRSTLKLISSRTHSIISQHVFDPCERILDLKCLSLEVSEETHERKDMIVVGTGITKGENVVTRGMIYIFDIVDVVPQPDIPETDLKLKLITKEDVRGAVTALCDIGSQGFLLAAQGQKCMVRGLREDNAILPVAFYDVQYYIKVAKELKGTGLTILGDAFSGLWMMGYSEEPYKFQLLGRDLEHPSVVAAEFFPQDKQLYIISSDGNGDLRIVQYDPENPKSERGTILLKRSTFTTGSYVTTMTLLPRMPTPSESLAITSASNNDAYSPSSMELDTTPVTVENPHQVLIATAEGGLSLITPLSENAYRRMNTLQNILLTQLEHPCGLNPRAYRAVETDGLGARGMIDGNLIKRWLGQSSQGKSSMADKVGGTVWEVRGDLEGILGGGLGYL